jgi:hypothetical protein
VKNDLNMQFSRFKLSVVVRLVLAILLTMLGYQTLARAQELGGVKTSSEGLISRVAPGEFLPISVKLMNFGGGRRVDAVVNYKILDSNDVEVLRDSETVAVETTASFVKTIQVPYNLPPGTYTVVSSIVYEGQEVPATSQFHFTVEGKIAGIFVSQLIIYGTITVAVGLVFAVVSRLIVKRRRAGRFVPHEYGDIPAPERLFYEIISDTIMQMRYRAGDRAIALARGVDGLIIDEENGRVLKINKDPAEIAALLILRYEDSLGEKAGLAPRKADEEAKRRLTSVDKNLALIKKYFK